VLVIVIAQPNPDSLCGLLRLGSAIFALPILALGGEEQVASAIDTYVGDSLDRGADQPMRNRLVIGQNAIAAAKCFLVAQTRLFDDRST